MNPAIQHTYIYYTKDLPLSTTVFAEIREKCDFVNLLILGADILPFCGYFCQNAGCLNKVKTSQKQDKALI